VSQVNGVPDEHSSEESSIVQGRALIASYGCGTCHAIPGVPGADAMAAPPLDRFWQRTYIAGVLPNTRTNLARWIQDPQTIIPGNAMPNLGVTEEEASDMVDYLLHQPTVKDLIVAR